MRHKLHLLLGITMSLPALLVASGAEPSPIIPEGEKVVVSLAVLGTDQDGPTKSDGSARWTISVGESACIAAGVGFFDKDGRAHEDNLCMNFTGGCPTPAEEEALSASHFWRASITPLTSEVGSIRLEVEWEHLFAESEGDYRVVAGDRRTLEFEEGGRHVLDYVSVPPGMEPRCNRNVLIEVSARVKEAPELADALLHYDLWFVHADDRGEESRRRFQAVGRQGEELEFRLRPYRWPVPGKYLLDGNEGYEVILEAFGTIRGRLRADGTIQTDLSVRRWHDMERAGRPRRGGIGGGGRKVFDLEPGATVSLVMPDARGTFSRDDEVMVDLVEFFAGHQDRAILTVSRAD